MSSANGEQQPVKLSLPLKYQQEIFQELRQKDELVVLARGLGLLRLVTNLLHSYDAAGNNLIILVGADDRENGWIGEALAEHAAISIAPKARGLSVVNTDVMSVGTREKMYAQGGIFSITSRILVVDLLTSLLDPETITGVVVLHADKVVATSLEAFILRIYRQKNKVGFLKAFSDKPEPFATGFSPLSTMMRNLFLRNVSIWPRFHINVAQALEGKKKAEVIELEVSMSDSMRDIQNAIMECVEVSIGELKKSNSGLDMEDWNVDSALHKQFDMVIRRQLDPVWHRPKWAVLAEVLDEIDRDLYFNPVPLDDSNGTVLIMCTDSVQCWQLREYLQNMKARPETGENDQDEEQEPSAEIMMRRKLRNYLEWKKKFAKTSATLYEENQSALNGNSNTNSVANSSRGKAPANKRRRVRGGASSSGSTHATNGSIQAAEDKPLEVAELMLEIKPTELEALQKEEVVTDPLDDMEDHYQLYEMKDLVVVHAYDGDMDEHLLEEVKPRYIIMYEPDTSFVRRVEVYRSSHNDRNVRVYFLYYGGSVEEQRYLSSTRREKDAFTKLIKEKANMSLVHTLDAHGIEDPQEAFLRTINTRIAGGGRLAATSQPPRVVVDVREFRSSLPSLLHGRNMIVVPCMLTVGDYVLSPSICVERKSIKDLISSFKDGRLYNQAETMLKHYKSPMLLIEFDQGKSFTLEPFADLSGSLSSVSAANASSDLQSKLVLLTLAFPKLRIIWSSSPYQTAEIFESLKTQEPEPDPIQAVKIGLEGGASAEDQAFNREPQDMLRVVPGVTGKNLSYLAVGFESIKEVANASLEELAPIVGKEAGRQIYQFFNKSVLE
ncbi:hypothetical protein DID88_006725 [Monilinia fructigena]|uniref:ERCC4 domain-containing protein n=1 Tax=Monilinia fructigena TaxID=38457 RepID=A0A395ILA8_9HELO|nr:hypothetical protein DID88_006725 [Monilinia fructigena]